MFPLLQGLMELMKEPQTAPLEPRTLLFPALGTPQHNLPTHPHPCGQVTLLGVPRSAVLWDHPAHTCMLHTHTYTCSHTGREIKNNFPGLIPKGGMVTEGMWEPKP
jgi:hypothetical protein